jgi:outer membrane receptor protein involved in Fe transport
MKRYIIIFFLITAVIAVHGQSKKRGRVKRKFRKVEQVNQNLPTANFRGIVRDEHKKPLPGALIEIENFKVWVHTNEFGEFFLGPLPTGRHRIQISYMGYETKTIDYQLSEGNNYHYIALDEKRAHVKPSVVTARKRPQQQFDSPAGSFAKNDEFLNQINATDLSLLSDFVPGFYYHERGAGDPAFVLRGFKSESIQPGLQPLISIQENHVPLSHVTGAAPELFDMERVSVFRGPQNTLFGQQAMAGAIHFASKKPTYNFDGYLTAGMGNYNRREVRGAVNLPILENMLAVRLAGIYNYRDGYVENTFGGKLYGDNTIGGRLSILFRPSINHMFDVVVSYQKDDEPGIGFMSKQFPNTEGNNDIFNYEASLNLGENLGTGKELKNATLTYTLFRNENKYWTSITSYRKSSSFNRWDDDGTAAPAIEVFEDAGATQFFQEVNFNFSRNSRLNGVIGGNYRRMKSEQTTHLSLNEQYTYHLLNNPAMMITSSGELIPMILNPGGTPLPEQHEEENYLKAQSQTIEAFLNANYRVTTKLFFSGGVRAAIDRQDLTNETFFAGGSESVLGQITGNSPNLFFRPYNEKNIENTSLSYFWSGTLKYRFSEKAHVAATYSRGRRPHSLQFSNEGEKQILEPEILDNYELGIRVEVLGQVYLDATGFYQQYQNFRSQAWIADSTRNIFEYQLKNGGSATSYGAEVAFETAITEWLDLFGNYAWLHARFDSTNTAGLEQQLAGKMFSYSPKHRFAVGMNARLSIAPNLLFFVTPSYSYKTRFYFDDANTSEMEQPAYGVLNANVGLEMADPNMVLKIYGTNLLGEEFVTGAGNSEYASGLPTFIPGPPRMLGAKLTWKF